ncbi:MAG TPA: efflux RND transporter periplasmic adaptor subunit, partial [Kiloniellales bacterium]|nr:efflux RND transporter periplasmic adaptor subunit [Kiloniellales bacterium]
IQELTAEGHRREIVLRGATEAFRAIDLKAEADGRVAEQLVPEGTEVMAGTPLVQLAMEDRAARVKEAEALVKQRQIEQEASVKLAKNGHRSAMDVAAAEAALQAAQAALEAARVELDNTTLLAPFDGVVERHLAKAGAFASRGDAVVRLVELDPLVVVAYANEQEVLAIQPGEPARARLTDGRELDGTIAYVARSGEPATRSFRVELHLDNASGALPAGITADILIGLPPAPAYKVSPAVLVLDEGGRLGVKALDAADQVIFLPAAIVDDEADGIWLGGLPPVLRLIVVGQEFVDVGERVRPVAASADNSGGA